MNEIKSIQKQIDDLIERVNEGEVTLSPEVANILDEIVNYATLIKAKDKTKPIEELVIKLDSLIKTLEVNKTNSEEANQALLSAIREIKIDVASPQVNVEPSQVNIPPIKVPKVEIPQQIVNFPEEISVSKPSWFKIDFSKIISAIQEIKLPKIVFPKSASEPISVRLSNGDKFYTAGGNSGGGVNSSFRNTSNELVSALVDSDGNVYTIEKTPTNLDSNQKTVTTAGSSVRLATNPCLSTTIKALFANTGLIFVGGSGVSSSKGFQLSAGESITYNISNTNKIYIDSAENGEGVSYTWVAE